MAGGDAGIAYVESARAVQSTEIGGERGLNRPSRLTQEHLGELRNVGRLGTDCTPPGDGLRFEHGRQIPPSDGCQAALGIIRYPFHAERSEDFVGEIPQDRLEQPALVAEQPVERRQRSAGARDDLGERRSGIPLLEEDLARRGEDRLPARPSALGQSFVLLAGAAGGRWSLGGHGVVV